MKLAGLAVVVLLALPFLPVAPAAASRVALPGNVSPALADAVVLGPADPEAQVDITVALRLRDEAGLARLIEAQQEPASGSYHRWLDADAFAARFAPTPDALAATRVWLGSAGLQVQQPTSRHLVAHGRVADAEAALGAPVWRVRLGERQGLAILAEPRVPASIAPLVAAASLDEVTQMSPLHAAPRYSTGGSGRAYLARDTQVAYDEKAGLFDAGIRGAGISLGVASSYDEKLSDLNDQLSRQGYPAFTSATSGARTTSSTCVPGTGSSSGGGCSWSSTNQNSLETQWDIDLSASIANDAHVGVYLSQTRQTSSFGVLYQYLADRAASVSVVTHSWGLCLSSMPSAQVASDDASFQQASSMGQAWFVASGDSGSNDCNTGVNAVDYPAASPWVTGAGGSMQDQTDAATWGADGWMAAYPPLGESGCSDGGGGIASTGATEARPSWQSGPGIAAGSLRLVPDVSMHYGVCGGASNARSYLIAFGGATYLVAGTSGDAPQWAGTWAALDTATSRNLGPAAPLLYRILRGENGTSYAAAFHDITTGSNGAYNAGAGFDMVTGIGTPRVAGLATQLRALFGGIHAVASAPASGANITRGVAVSFAGAETDVTCPASAWDWDFGDGTAHAATQNASHVYAASVAPGSLVAKLRVTGTCGAQDNATVALSVVDVAPTAVLAAPTSATAGVAFTLSGAGSSDADDAAGPVRWRFVLDGLTLLDGANATVSATATAAGQHAVALTVFDRDGVSSPTVSATIEVVPGALAVIGVTPADATLAADGSLAFTATGADAYGNARSTSPTWSAGCGSVDASGSYHAPTLVGDCSVRAQDGGVQGSANVHIVPASAAQVVFVVAPAATDADTPATFLAEARDAYGNARQDAVTYTLLAGTGSVASSTFTPDKVGDATVRASVGALHADALIAVAHGRLASIAVSPSGATLYHGQTLAMSATGFDAHANAFAIAPSWNTTLGSILANGTYLATSVGNGTIDASVGAVHASVPVTVLPSLKVRVAAERAIYGQLGALTGGIRIVVTVTRLDGTLLPGATVSASIRSATLGLVQDAVGTTGADGAFRFDAELSQASLGDHILGAGASLDGDAASASGAYTVSSDVP